MENLSRIYLFFALAVLGTTASGAAGHPIENLTVLLDVQPDGSVIQEMHFYFREQITSPNLTYNLNNDITDLEVLDGSQKLRHEVAAVNGLYAVNIFLESPTKDITIRFVSKETVFRSSSANQFSTSFSFEQAVSNMNIRVTLPVGYVIDGQGYFPPDARTISDGKRIMLEWSGQDITEPLIFSVKYSAIGGSEIVIVLLIISVVAIIFFAHFRNKVKDAFLRGFRNDEKKVLERLQANKMILQKEIEEEFGFSRAKTTRIVSKLEEQELVRKEKYGRTNKVFWLK
ncbi:MAG: hypothetical protein HY364_03600 [Candidatus Aenigmarchaeota archaeon]|nr:hypothetical protein [Candidatus Aenigmarchaeota archaeon]